MYDNQLLFGASNNNFLKVPKESLHLSPRKEKNFRNSPAVLSRAAFWITAILMVTLNFPKYFSNISDTAPNAPIISFIFGLFLLEEIGTYYYYYYDDDDDDDDDDYYYYYFIIM